MTAKVEIEMARFGAILIAFFFVTDYLFLVLTNNDTFQIPADSWFSIVRMILAIPCGIAWMVAGWWAVEVLRPKK